MSTTKRWVSAVAMVMVVVFGGAACSPPTKPFEFHLGGVGKADGVAILTDEDVARIEAAFETAIKKGEAEVARLTTEIAKLEADAKRKQSEIDTLVSRIATRKAEIERDFKAQLALGIGLGLLSFGIGSLLAGAGAVASLAAAMRSDSRLQQAERDLAAARAQQTSLRNQAAQYQTKKAAITKQLEAIRQSKQRLLVALQQPALPAGAALAAYPGAAATHRRWKIMEDIVAHTRAEIAALTELKKAASDLVAALDAALVVLAQLAADADRLAQETHAEFFTILQAALAGDPLAVASDWLAGHLAYQTRTLLVALDVPFADFVAHLVKTRFTGTPEQIEALTQQLLERLVTTVIDEATAPAPSPSMPPTSTGWSWHGSNTSALPIEDESLSTSTIEVPQRGALTHVELHVTITHSYVGDLVLMVAHGDTLATLVKQTDDLAGQLDETWVLPDFAGADAAGAWELLISDEQGGDVGTLTSWALSLQGTD